MGKKKKKKYLGYYDWGSEYDEPKKKYERRGEILPQAIKDQMADSLERFMQLKNYCIVIDNSTRMEHDAACRMIWQLIDLLRDGSPEAEDQILDKANCQKYLDEIQDYENGSSVEEY